MGMFYTTRKFIPKITGVRKSVSTVVMYLPSNKYFNLNIIRNR